MSGSFHFTTFRLSINKKSPIIYLNFYVWSSPGRGEYNFLQWWGRGVSRTILGVKYELFKHRTIVFAYYYKIYIYLYKCTRYNIINLSSELLIVCCCNLNFRVNSSIMKLKEYYLCNCVIVFSSWFLQQYFRTHPSITPSRVV